MARAAFSAAKDHFAWQAQHFEHVMIFCVASAAFSAAKDHFAWQAQHLKHVMIKKRHAAVGKPAIVTCFARLKNLNRLFSLREEDEKNGETDSET